ncbi:MAG: hypothetical protein ACT6T0_13065 [Nevskia sp.]
MRFTVRTLATFLLLAGSASHAEPGARSAASVDGKQVIGVRLPVGRR